MNSLRVCAALSCWLGFGAAVVSAADRVVVPLWENGAPGFESSKDLPEKVVGTNVSGIHFPTLTVFLPDAAKSTGAAVIVAPGGGHRRLAIEHEGYNVAQWLADHGVAGFVLKYRLANDDSVEAGQSPYKIDVHELDDALRAIQLVRSRASEWKLDPERVGILGFSAGGEVALLAATRPVSPKLGSERIATFPSRPNFVALLYPGGLPRTDIEITAEAPPMFLLCGYQDRQNISEGLAEFYLKCKRAGVVAELHIYSGTGHGFGLRASNQTPAGDWPARFRDWLGERGFLKAQ